MPIVHVDFWEGVGEGQVKKMIRGITNVMMDIGVPERAVEVVVYEIPKTPGGVGGRPASEALKDVQPPKYHLTYQIYSEPILIPVSSPAGAEPGWGTGG